MCQINTKFSALAIMESIRDWEAWNIAKAQVEVEFNQCKLRLQAYQRKAFSLRAQSLTKQAVAAAERARQEVQTKPMHFSQEARQAAETRALAMRQLARRFEVDIGFRMAWLKEDPEWQERKRQVSLAAERLKNVETKKEAVSRRVQAYLETKEQFLPLV